MKRTEHDLLGDKEIPAQALYGIHTRRAMENFPVSGRRVHKDLIHAYGAVKLACARTSFELGRLNEEKYLAISRACEELRDGRLDRFIRVDALQGGAGTSTNMNVNEVIANRALQILGREPGDYAVIHPIDDVNLFQSTNDTYPTALKIAAITGIRRLEEALIKLLEAFQHKERETAHVVKVGRTQLQDATLTTMGRSMAAYAEALGRDRWRIYKCEERLRTVNLGGTAIGTGLTAPRQYIFRVVETLKRITGIGLARAENLIDATQNVDVFTEVSGILSGCASNLLKISSDLRLLASGPDAGLGEIRLPAVQAGSTIMPAKVNPVIPEAVTQAALVIIANHSAIATACGMGSLELNPFLPMIGDRLLESIDLLCGSCTILCLKCVRQLEVDEALCRRNVETATATLTALAAELGYSAAEQVAEKMKTSGRSIRRIVVEEGLLTEEQYLALTSAEAVVRLGSG